MDVDFDAWFVSTYAELKSLTYAQLRHERVGHTLSPTAILHEAYLTLRGSLVYRPSKAYMFASFRNTVRRLLIDYARHKGSRKRRKKRSDFVNADYMYDGCVQIIDRDSMQSMLECLSKCNARAAMVAQIRVNTDLSLQTIADRIGVSLRTVSSDWNFAIMFARDWMESRNLIHS